MINPIEKYVVIHPSDDNGEDVKFSLLLVLSRPLNDHVGDSTIGARLMENLSKINGIDSLQPNVGRYTVGITIARTFDPDEVISAITKAVEDRVLTEIITPKLIT